MISSRHSRVNVFWTIPVFRILNISFHRKTINHVNPLYSDEFSHIYITTISMVLPIVYFNWSQVDFFLNYDLFLSLKAVFNLSKQYRP